MDDDADATGLVTSSMSGDAVATDELLELVYDQLRALAADRLRRERPDHTLQPTALVHEAYLRLVKHDRLEWQGRTHFLALAASTMRRLLVNHARDRRASKRGGGANRVTLSGELIEDGGNQPVDALALDELLEKLAEHNERRARVVELRFFAGLSVDETAGVLEVSPRTVKDDWRFARVWLLRALRERDEDPTS